MNLPMPDNAEKVGPGIYMTDDRLIIVAPEVLAHLGIPMSAESLADLREAMQSLAESEGIAGGCRWFAEERGAWAPVPWEDFVRAATGRAK